MFLVAEILYDHFPQNMRAEIRLILRDVVSLLSPLDTIYGTCYMIKIITLAMSILVTDEHFTTYAFDSISGRGIRASNLFNLSYS